jgi:hypothetical protein
VEFWGSCLRLCENARQSQAASWRAASSFPLVNYLPVAPVHEPGCQLVDHVALVQLDSVDTEPMDTCNALTAPSEGLRRLARASGHLLRRIAGLREHNGEVVGDATWPAIIDRATHDRLVGLLDDPSRRWREPHLPSTCAHRGRAAGGVCGGLRDRPVAEPRSHQDRAVRLAAPCGLSR